MTKLNEVSGQMQPVQIAADEVWFKVTARHVNGKAHRAYATQDGHILSLSCSCPGSRNGSARKKCYVISNGWEKSNCGN